MCVKKHIIFRALDRDPTVAMRFGALNRGRHNSTLKPRVRSADRWSGVHAIDAWISDAPSIQRPTLIHVPAI